MFNFTLSNYFGSLGGKWLHIIVVINWQLSKQGTTDQYHLTVSRAQVSTHRGPVPFWLLTTYWFSSDRRLKFIFFQIYNDDNDNNGDNDNDNDNDNDDDDDNDNNNDGNTDTDNDDDNDDDDNDNNIIITINHCKHKLNYLLCMLL